MANLPQEILDAIVEALPDFDALKTTSLVCRSLAHASQRQLFHYVNLFHLADPARDQAIQELLRSQNHIATHVRSLIFGIPDQDLVRSIDTLGRCTHLRELFLFELRFEGPDLARTCSRLHLPLLKKLKMANCVFGSPDAWRSLLRAMPNVSFLVLFSCDFDNAKEASLGETLPCSIQKLGLIFNDSAANAVSYLALQHLAELELELRDTTDADLLRTVLEESDRSLTTLCVLGQFLFPQRMADLSECFVATKRAALRAVQVRGLKSASVPSYATLLGALLSSLSSPVIERIGLQWEQHPEADTLQVIDSILSSTTTFPSLKEFALFTNGTNGDAVPFPDTLLCLPQLALRGVLPSASEYHRYDWKALLRQGS